MSDNNDFVIENGVLKKYIGILGAVITPDFATNQKKK